MLRTIAKILSQGSIFFISVAYAVRITSYIVLILFMAFFDSIIIISFVLDNGIQRANISIAQWL